MLKEIAGCIWNGNDHTGSTKNTENITMTVGVGMDGATTGTTINP
jgi:hypothetical protein